MKEVYNKKYYRVDLIPKYRQEYISLKLEWFISLYKLQSCDWPIDCVYLIKKMKELQLIPFEYGILHLPDKLDALIEYRIEHNVYLMPINENKYKYPFEYSRDRRLNFTLAHEIAHIVLEHLLIPNSAKTKMEIEIEEIEADEFAGRLLMPERLLFSCNYYSLESISEFFKVSKTSFWKRLNSIKRLDLLCSKKIQACSHCGNTHFSIFAEFCGICGHTLRNGRKGIQRIYYDEEIPLSRYNSVIRCPHCKSQHFQGDKCSRCGTYIFNYCTDYFNENADCTSNSPGNCRFCEMCGKPTYFYQKGFLKCFLEIENI